MFCCNGNGLTDTKAIEIPKVIGCFLIFTLIGFATIYITLFIVELFLMFKYARLGPSDSDSNDDECEKEGGSL